MICYILNFGRTGVNSVVEVLKLKESKLEVCGGGLRL